MGKSVEKYGRKVKEITVFKKALDAANAELSSLIRSSRNKSTTNSTRRNLGNISNGMASPTNQHVLRIRGCYQKSLKEREQFNSTSRFISLKTESRLSESQGQFYNPFTTTSNRNLKTINHSRKSEIGGLPNSPDRPQTVPENKNVGKRAVQDGKINDAQAIKVDTFMA